MRLTNLRGKYIPTIAADLKPSILRQRSQNIEETSYVCDLAPYVVECNVAPFLAYTSIDSVATQAQKDKHEMEDFGYG